MPKIFDAWKSVNANGASKSNYIGARPWWGNFARCSAALIASLSPRAGRKMRPNMATAAAGVCILLSSAVDMSVGALNSLAEDTHRHGLSLFCIMTYIDK